MVAHPRTMDDAAAPELDDTPRAVPRAAGALLTVHLAAGAVDLTALLHLVGAGAPLGELPVDDARQNVGAHRQTEHLVGEVDLTDLRVLEVLDRDDRKSTRLNSSH